MQPSGGMRREIAKSYLRRMGGAKRYPSPSAPALMGIASLHPSYESNDGSGLIPRDDLAFALMNIRRVQRSAAAPPHQEFRTPSPDRVVAPAPHGGFARLVFQQLRKRENVAPHLPRGCDLFAVGTDAQGNGQ